jgi:hypothetical protein
MCNHASTLRNDKSSDPGTALNALSESEENKAKKRRRSPWRRSVFWSALAKSRGRSQRRVYWTQEWNRNTGSAMQLWPGWHGKQRGLDVPLQHYLFLCGSDRAFNVKCPEMEMQRCKTKIVLGLSKREISKFPLASRGHRQDF